MRLDDWWLRCLEFHAQLERRTQDERHPGEASRDRIERWSVATHLETWRAPDISRRLDGSR
jgi:hypothetical protein